MNGFIIAEHIFWHLGQELEVVLIELIDDINAHFLAEFAELHSAHMLQQACLDHLATMPSSDVPAVSTSNSQIANLRCVDSSNSSNKCSRASLSKVLASASATNASDDGGKNTHHANSSYLDADDVPTRAITAGAVRAGRGRLRRLSHDN